MLQWPGRLLSGANERLNPLVLKELRQAVHSRFVATVLMLFLALLLLIISLYVMMNEDIATEMRGGAYLFMILQVALLATTLLFTAAYGGIRMAMETAQQNTDLLFITTIRPTSIIAGKVVAGLALTMMIFAAAAPFMVLTYLLRGIDVATIVFILGIDLLAILLVMQAAMLVGAMPTGLVLKVILGLVLLGWIIGAFSFVMMMTGSLAWSGVGTMMMRGISAAEFWSFTGATVGGVLVGAGLLFFLTVLCISPALSNRTTPIRLYITAAWLVSGAGVVWLAWSGWFPQSWVPLVVWAVIAAAFFGLVMLFVVSERDEPGRRLRGSIPRSPLLRPFAFLTYSGSAGGVIWCALLSLATLAAVYWTMESLAAGTPSGSMSRHGSLMAADERSVLYALLAAFPVYGYCYAMTAALIRQIAGRHRLKTAITGPLALGLMGLGAAAPALVMFFVNPDSMTQEHPMWMLPDPAAVMWFGASPEAAAVDYRLAAFTMLIVWGVIVTAANGPWLIGQMRRFKPLTAESRPAAASATASSDPERDTATQPVSVHG